MDLRLYHANSMLKTSYIIKPLDAFETFDKEHRDEIDEIEFCELMHALYVVETVRICKRYSDPRCGSIWFADFIDQRSQAA